MHFCVFSAFLTFASLVICVPASQKDAAAFGDKLTKITKEVLGSQSFKNHLIKKRNFESKRLNADQTVKKLASAIGKKISDREQAITKLQDAVKRSFYRKSWGLYTECCRFSEFDLNFEYDHRFLGKVDVNSLCLMRSSSASKEDRIPNDDFLKTAKDNLLRYPGIKSQYFGSDNGTLLRFPAAVGQTCGTYDNRYRPWYVQASAPTSKDIVLVLDMSGSMERHSRLQATIDAATTILGTLSPNDRVAVIAFSDAAYVVGSDTSTSAISDKYYSGFRTRKENVKNCYDETMLSATPRNLKHLMEAVKNMVPHGDTNYAPGLEKAYDLLYRALVQDVSKGCTNSKTKMSATEIASSRHRAIVFLSDGKPTDTPKTILDLIYHRSREMHNSVVVLCYALGDGTFGHFMHKMSQQRYVPRKVPACNHRSDIESLCSANGSLACGLPKPKEGQFRQIFDIGHLRSEMGSYYTFFAVKSQDPANIPTNYDAVIWSVPYFDAGGSGMVFTAASPVVIQGRLVGVLGSDLTMREMMAEVTYFHTGGEDGYAFMMDQFGRVFLHPYMPSPSAVSEDPVLTDIGALERDPAVKEFLNNILQKLNEDDNKIHKLTTKIKFVTPKEHRNVDTRDATMTYHCMKVKHLVICVVVESGRDSQIRVQKQHLQSDYSFVYHRFDIKQPESRCNYKGQLSSGKTSSVFLAPSAFIDVGAHLGRPETLEDTTRLEQYMKDDSSVFSHEAVNLRAGIKDSSRLTSAFNDIWRDLSSTALSVGEYTFSPNKMYRNILFRYFSSEDGVFRIQPGIKMPKSYNPVHRPWYIQARALLDEILTEKPCVIEDVHCGDVAAVSPPYVDATGAGVVVTISQAVLTPVASGGGTTSWHLVGVVGGDLKLSFLEMLLRGSVEACKAQSGQKCILIDLAGYIIYDSILLGMDDTALENIASSNYHLTHGYGMLADELIRLKILVKQQCADVSKIAYLEEYRIDTAYLKKMEDSLPFKAVRVNHTNTVLLVVPTDLRIPQYFDRKKCIEHHESSAICERPFGSERCESPCVNLKEAQRTYEVCNNTFNYSWENPPPCVPEKFIDERFGFIVEQDGSAKLDNSDIVSLKPCFGVA